MREHTASQDQPGVPPDRGVQWFRAWDHDKDSPAEWKYEYGQGGQKTPYTDLAVQLITKMPGGRLEPRKDPPWTDKLYYPAADRDEDGKYAGTPASVPRNDMPARWNQRALRWEVIATPTASAVVARITGANREKKTYSWEELEFSGNAGWALKRDGQSGDADDDDFAVDLQGSAWVMVGSQVSLQRVGNVWAFQYVGGLVFGQFSRWDQSLGYFNALGQTEEFEFDSEFPESPDLDQADFLGFAYNQLDCRWKLIAQQCST